MEGETNGEKSSNDVSHSNASSTNEQPVHTSNPVVILNKQRLQELVQEIDPREQLDDDVEDMLLTIADDFIDNLVTSACQLAKHRGSKTVDVKDIQLILEKNYNMLIPGFGSLPLFHQFKHLYKKSPTTEAHKQRMALIKKTLKKF
ncbi:transcription initiation factor TFIID subunit 12-like protein [Leptotrombidium deliense]|uniref:Transcription initiation factor TFIID subunit 12 n=1 Tax=Leptotrombidium deliense TaxID=299467 RepID=A0A443RTJ7_9ACAR|nr:transcription initiation factor TFIID subunit 12-like protein [Leptotrombidium deliense]